MDNLKSWCIYYSDATIKKFKTAAKVLIKLNKIKTSHNKVKL